MSRPPPTEPERNCIASITARSATTPTIADFAIHQPDKEDGGIPNPHFHVLCPIRPIEESGKWGFKQRRVYRLDEDGNRIMGEDGKPLFDAVPTTDWGSPETLEARLPQEYTAEYEQYRPIQDDLRRLQQVKRNADAAIRQQEQTRQKRWEVER